MRNLGLVAFSFVLLVGQTTAAALVPLHPWWPQLLLPIVVYLGVSPETGLLRGTALSFVLGYLTDAFCGSPMGLETFVMVAVYMLARAVRTRLLLRGTPFQVLITFVFSVVAGGLVLALEAIFERTAAFPLDRVEPALLFVFAPSLTTALTAPFLFAAAQRIEQLSRPPRHEEALL